MAVKTITVTEEAYRKLKAHKGASESFSQTIVRLTARRPLASFAGALSPESARALRQEIQRDRVLRARLDAKRAARH